VRTVEGSVEMPLSSEYENLELNGGSSPAEQSALYAAGANGVVPEQSVAEQLRASFAVAQTQRTTEIRIPGYTPALFGVFRGIDDYSELRQMIVGVVKKTRYLPKGQLAQQQIALGSETIIRASTDTYVLKDDGEKVVLGKRMGIELYDLIFPDEGSGSYRPMTDSEALILLFPLGTSSLMTVAAELDQWMKDASQLTEEELLGE
jgi:hypothetical protein